MGDFLTHTHTVVCS